MGNSLQDQLLKAGLANEKQAKKAKAAQVPKKRGKKGQAPVLNETTRAAQQAMAEKAERDKALNEKRKAEAERKALAAQVRQLIEHNRLPRDEGEIGYNFVDGGKVRKVFVTADMRARLGNGRLDIVRLDGRYEVVTADIAEKIRARNATFVVAHPTSEPEPAEDDPYKDFKVPDDLMW